MEKAFYSKELGEQTAIYLSNGHPMKFDYLETSDAWLIMELDAAIQNGVGGVTRITQAQHEEGVKKKSEEKSRNGSQQYRQELQSPNMFNIPGRVSPAGRAVVAPVARIIAGKPTELPDPLQVPDPSQFKMPSVGKVP